MTISNGNDNIVQNILKKDDGLAIDSIDFWSPHSRNKGGMRIYWSSNKGYGNLDIVKLKGFSKYGDIILYEDGTDDKRMKNYQISGEYNKDGSFKIDKIISVEF